MRIPVQVAEIRTSSAAADLNRCVAASIKDFEVNFVEAFIGEDGVPRYSVELDLVVWPDSAAWARGWRLVYAALLQQSNGILPPIEQSCPMPESHLRHSI